MTRHKKNKFIMKHTVKKQEFLVIGRSTIESQSQRGHQGQRTIEKVIKGIIIQ